jgi:[ribosomal protein S5]-alanine N-acetyltransferase
MHLETPRLHLREITAEDWPTVLAYQSDPCYLRYYAWTERAAADVQRFIQELVALNHEQPRRNFHFGVVLRGEGRLIGLANLRRRTADDRQADIGYELAPAHWGHGYATEAARELLRFGFRELRVHRIWATCNAENAASSRVLTKLGMLPEGRLRETDWFKGRWWDTLVYGILEQEWKTDDEHNSGTAA